MGASMKLLIVVGLLFLAACAVESKEQEVTWMPCGGSNGCYTGYANRGLDDVDSNSLVEFCWKVHVFSNGTMECAVYD